MKILLLILCLLFAGKTGWGQSQNDTQFLSEVYTWVAEYTVWNDTVHSFQNAPADSAVEFYFFSSSTIERRGDSTEITLNIGSVTKRDLVLNNREWLFNSCTPYIQLSKTTQDSCWRGLYASESTGYCTVIMTVKEGTIRIAGIGEKAPFVFYSQYKALRPPAHITKRIRDYLKR